MKKVIFASVSALCAFVGFSSFQAERLVNVRYFDVKSTESVTPGTGTILDSKVTIRGSQTPPTIDCPGAGLVCIIAVDTVNLTANKQHLNTASGPVAYSTIFTRS